MDLDRNIKTHDPDTAAVNLMIKNYSMTSISNEHIMITSTDRQTTDCNSPNANTLLFHCTITASNGAQNT